MNECPYESLPIGTIGNGVGSNIHCGSCGHQFPSGLFRVRYEGHRTEGDVIHLFTVMNPCPCPTCGTMMREFTGQCSSGGVWVNEVVNVEMAS